MIKLVCYLIVISITMFITYVHYYPNLRESYTIKEDELCYEDSEVLASVINSECSNCSEVEMYLVGSVVLNRVHSLSWPKTIDSVINEPNQFYTNTSLFVPTSKTLIISQNLLKGLYVCPGILYFCTKESSVLTMDTVLIRGKYHLYGK